MILSQTINSGGYRRISQARCEQSLVVISPQHHHGTFRTKKVKFSSMWNSFEFHVIERRPDDARATVTLVQQPFSVPLTRVSLQRERRHTQSDSSFRWRAYVFQTGKGKSKRHRCSIAPRFRCLNSGLDVTKGDESGML
jgi:hypothetical protein